jgi:hypothetical protein
MAGRPELLDQSRRAGQRVGQDPDHGFFNLPGSEPPALRAVPASVISAAET